MNRVQDSFLDLERRRKQLEQNVAETHTLLKHWQTWEAEYEGLKEEIQALGAGASLEKFNAIAGSFEGELLKSEEILKLLRDDKGNTRDTKQIQGLLSRRIDYVQENVRSLQKRFDAAEQKLAAVNVVMRPEATDEEGLPLTEITEELDDDDNVISSYTQTPGDVAPQIVEVLRKQGVKDIPELNTQSTKTSISIPTASGKGHVDVASGGINLSTASKKKVTFSELAADEISPIPAGGDLPRSSAVHLDVVEQLSKDESISEPIIPAGETPEEAQLRREMLQYNMNDIGAIVAEINLEEKEEADHSSDEYSVEDSDEEDEDQYGRTRSQIVDDRYRTKMLELERKLNAKSMINAGPDFQGSATEDSSLREPDMINERKESLKKKGVRFAETLDIQEGPNSQGSDLPVTKTVIKRNIPDRTLSKATQMPKKISAFKAARASQVYSDTGSTSKSTMVQTKASFEEESIHPPLTHVELRQRGIVPEGPPGQTIVDELVERPMSESEDIIHEPDEVDPHIMQQETAMKYHEMRNRFIQRNGGFVERDEDEPDLEQPRVSRFKAARLTSVKK